MPWNSRRFAAEPPSVAASLPVDETRCRAEAPVRINGVMGTSAQPTAMSRPGGVPLVRRERARWLVRAPGQGGALCPEEAAHALQAKRAQLRRSLDCRRDVAGVPAYTRDEIVDEAICLVVMSSKPIRGEDHLTGAFWTSVGFLLAEHRAGRRDLRVGSRRRVDYEQLVETVAGNDEPFDLVAARERIATAADLMAQLDPFEKRVLAVMAVHGLGVKRAAKALGEPVKTVLAASRGAQRKLDRVAAIAAAGRMCDYRERAIAAHAHGTAHAEQERAARAHLAACASCRSSYATLLRELGGREFQRAASAALLPPPVLAVELHGRWIERLTTLLSTGRTPTGTATAERTAGVLGGGGLVKAAAATSALVIAGAGVGAKVVRSLETSAPVHRRDVATHPAASTAATSVQRPTASGELTTTRTATSPRAAAAAPVKHHSTAPPPSRDLGYLAIGQSSGATEPQTEPRASAASAATSASTATSAAGDSTVTSESTRTGGGSSLAYLGH